MAEILLISGSPTASSKSAALLEYAREWLRDRSPFETLLVSVRDFPAIDYAVKPVLSTLGASDVLQGVYLVDQQFRIENGQPVIADEVRQRPEESLAQLVANLEIRAPVQ